MAIVLGVTFAACIALVLALVLLIRRLAEAGGHLPVTAEWIDELSMERYRPMMRLLDSEDLRFLRSQPGYTSRMEAGLRAQRCQIFRGYLRCLSADFALVCTALKVLMVQSRYDRPDLATALLRSQALFAAGIVSVRLRLFLYRWGLCSVDVRPLVLIFDGMRMELRSLVPATAAMSA
jgi:hypothetical protein